VTRGVCLWFTGLSGSGKSTTAQRVTRLLEERGRVVTVLDGDVVRMHLSSELGFERRDRDVNVRRIGYVASEIVRHGGIVACAVVSPYRATRDEVRAMMPEGNFVEIFVDTPLEVCEQRDVKGLYARARDGSLAGLTGVDDPYEPPLAPELRLDTVRASIDENAARVIRFIEEHGLLGDGSSEPARGALAERAPA
jgi:sulfate adenylyltransferase